MKNLTIYTLSLILIDQIIKYVVDANIALNNSVTLIKNFLNLTYVRNTGAAFSILEDGRIFLIIVSFLALFLILNHLNKKKLTKIDYFAFSFLIAGIAGNLMDRIIHGYVIDYINFEIIHFPIFNFADILIIVGALTLFIYSFKKEKNHAI